MEIIKKYVWYTPLATTAFIYAWQGVQALLGSAEHQAIIGVLGFSGLVSTLLGYVIAPLDIGVAALLVFRPNKWIFVWAALWPWVPRAMEWYGGLNVEFGETLFLSVAAAIAYFVFKRQRQQRQSMSSAKVR